MSETGFEDGIEGSVSGGESEDGGIEVKQLEVAGIITDDYGNKWQVPADNVDDLDDLSADNGYKLPKELTDKFWVQGIGLHELDQYRRDGYVPVRREEVGIPAQVIKDLGTGANPLDSYHVVGDMILVKIPHVFRDRKVARETKEVKTRLAAMEPTPEMIARAKQSGVIMTASHRATATIVNPEHRPPFLRGDK